MSDESQAAVAEPVEPTVQKTRGSKKSKPKRQPRYHVILWDDQDHTFEYVILMLRQLFGYPPEKGLQLADEVNSQGRVIVMTTTREHAELKRDQIHAFGKDPFNDECKGSMSASIEPVPE